MPATKAKALLRQSGLHAKKGLGQHFLVDGRVLGRIVAAADLTPQDTVIEVGPGLGILTQELLQRAGRVMAIEADAEMVSALGELAARSPNLTIIHGDIMHIDPVSLLSSPNSMPSSYKVVANIPYYITSALLRHFLEASRQPALLVVMVQKEVGKAIVARPGDMSLLAVSIQFYGKPSIVARVPARSFYPPPKVDSVILRVDVYEKPPVSVPSARAFFETVRAGFSAPRKQLRNSLAQGLAFGAQEAAGLLQRAGIDPRRRAETLSIEEWGRLCMERDNLES
ncbi:MAG: ribosomal RNA small subunit methyltransferase A [Dehalococcoidia bacterium]|nr:ribosomal RNA small subunit methyltransferase A [Dehalococcoidia bacterium]